MSSASASIPPDSGAIRFNRLQLVVVVVGVLLICAFAGSSAYDAWRSYRYSVAATERELRNLANALAEQTAWSLEAVDLLLLDTAQWYRTESPGIPESPTSVGTVTYRSTSSPLHPVGCVITSINRFGSLPVAIASGSNFLRKSGNAAPRGSRCNT